MHCVCGYRIKVDGELDAAAFNPGSPYPVVVTRREPDGTRFTAQADQSGLIGLIRYLHHRGFVLLSLCRVQNDSSDGSGTVTNPNSKEAEWYE